ncbi:MAG: glycosyltransferase [Planctomycetota bacterium]|nr:glycosyltransferase [Planctomycetota bacterium]
MAIDLSIVIPTCNRGVLLEKCLLAVGNHVACDYEIIVVDGASTDGTRSVLDEACRVFGDRLKIIWEETRGGFVRAANRGFRAASGRNLTWLNDDARPLAGALDQAVAQMDGSPDDVAFLAMFHRWNSTRNIAYEMVERGQVFRLCHIRGTLYANFALGRRETFERLGYFDESFYFCAADPDLSLKAWNAGMRVEPAYGAIIDHDQTDDDRRSVDSNRAQRDNDRLFAKWNLPARNPLWNDFDPARPCTLGGLRHTQTAAAA